MTLKVGITTGLYSISRAEELATTVRKLGFGLTRGTSVIEIPVDVPHEITETEGKEMRYIAEKQGITLLSHGSLTISMGIPERGEWRDAQDHMQKSVRSAVYSGSKYVNFHSCLNLWLELMTYSSRKLTMAFCDHEGNFITNILKGDSKESSNLRKWFIKERGDLYFDDIFNRKERTEIEAEISTKMKKWEKEEQENKIREILTKELPDFLVDPNTGEKIPRKRIIDRAVRDTLTMGTPPRGFGATIDEKIMKLWEKLRMESIFKHVEIQRNEIEKALENKLSKGEKWNSEELRAVVGILDGYHIMGNYLFNKKDPMWLEIAKFYKDILKKYKIDYDDPYWLHNAWKEAEHNNDREFKEFFYGAICAKFLQGHIKKLLNWIDGEFMDELKAMPDKTEEDKKNKAQLIKAAKELQICIESPDARDPSHGGLFLLWRPKQIYAAIKVIRRELKTNRVWMLQDYEHVATQGVDPIKEMEEIIKIAPDFGKFSLAVHANAPNPLHAHEPIELGDIRIYKLLYYLRITGFGKENRTGYVIFERGGAKDPYQKSVDALKIMVEFLEKEVHPDKLPLEFYGLKGATAGDLKRQAQIIRNHVEDPLKDLLEMPEEDWSMLSQAAIKKGRKPEAWKRGEYR